MKKLLSLAALLTVSTVAVAGFNNTNAPQTNGGVATVVQALTAADDAQMSLKGKITRQLDKDEFMFQDGTGEIKIEIDDKVWQGQNVTPNDVIIIFGKVDKNTFGKSDFDVYRVEKQ
ncbi:hypothetical protein B0187_09100 [Haemophilus paracuniculus]|uniref:Uncharacterized protein n=1 Tax=Haemophilus paracuniculus TaxID=734 RepID=A0A1T0APU9_9PAST|nr:NirD/YgiW/YdeI family stress tolerance protein [Haemophilus paracuniculus]OOR98237.1 hypothetical protein B0187_09100 [Haemophilus paracuniculus]